MTIVIGVVLAQIVSWAIAMDLPTNFTEEQILTSWYGQSGWRWMFAVQAVPAAFFFTLMFIVPESPRWLVKNAKNKQAELILTRIGGPEFAAAEVASIRSSLANEMGRTSFKVLLELKTIKIIGIGIVLATLQQWCGINVIFYYAEEVFKAAGYDIGGIMLNIVWTGLIMLLFTFVAIYTVDRIGR